MITLTLPPLHPAQKAIFESDKRFVIARCGRRFGKTRLAVLRAFAALMEQRRVWWVAPTYQLAQVGYREVGKLCRQVRGVQERKSDKRFVFGNGEFAARSADNPQGLRSEGLDLVIIDEAAYCHPDTWYEALRPTLSDRLGKALFISTPKGNNWYSVLWNEASGNPVEWDVYHYRTADNPYIAASEVEAARKGLPALVFQQEYEANFISGGGIVFRDVQACVDDTPMLEEGESGAYYVIGVDLAKMQDFTVFTVIDTHTRRVVRTERYQQVSYVTQATYLQSLRRKFNDAACVVERNNVGEPFMELCNQRGFTPQAFTTTNATKQALIDNLVVAFEQGTISIPDDRTLIDELSAFGMEMLPSGAIRYGAPSGLHDDHVMSLGLAWHGVEYSSEPQVYTFNWHP